LASLQVPETIPPDAPADAGAAYATNSVKNSKGAADSGGNPLRPHAKSVVDTSQAMVALPMPVPNPFLAQPQPQPQPQSQSQIASTAIPDSVPAAKSALSVRTILSVPSSSGVASSATGPHVGTHAATNAPAGASQGARALAVAGSGFASGAAGPQSSPPEVPGETASPRAIPNQRAVEGDPGASLQDAPVKAPKIGIADRGPDSELDAAAQVSGASAAELADAGRSSLSGGRQSMAQADAARRTPGSGSIEAVSSSAHGLAVQPPAAAGEVSAAVHGSIGAHGDINAINALRTDGGATSTSASSASSSREPFAALDGDALSGATLWTHAGARSAEAGFEDPTLGWVGVRADLGAGGVHAAVVPGSAEAAQMLGSHMAGLHAYLSEQRSPVNTVTLASPSGLNTGSGQGTNEQMQQGHGRGDAERAPSPPAEVRPTGPLPGGTGSPESRLPAGSPNGFNPPQARAGTHISVVA
jgi:hypothetical protein